MIEIFLLILIIVICFINIKYARAEEIIGPPYTKLEYTNPRYIEYEYPFYCIDSRPYYGELIPQFSEDKINIIKQLLLIRNKKRQYMYHNRLYAEIYSVVAFLTKIKKHLNLPVVLIEPPHKLISKIITKIFKLEISDYNNNCPKNCILINITIFEEDKPSFIALYNCVYNEYIFMNKIIEEIKPRFSFHIMRTFNQDFMADIPANSEMVLIPFASCSISHSYGLIYPALSRNEFRERKTSFGKEKTSFGKEKTNLYDIWARLVLFDLCIRNLNHGYHQYDSYDTMQARKYEIEKYLGPIPEIPLKNTSRHFATHKISNLIDYKFTIPYNIYKLPSPIIQPIIKKVNNLSIYIIPLFDIGVYELSKSHNLGYYMETEKKEYLLKYKFSGTIYSKYKPPQISKYKYIQVASYEQAQKLAKSDKIILMPEDMELDILIKKIYNYIKNIDFPYFENIYIMGEHYNAPVICALHMAFPYAYIHVIGEIEKTYTINYPYTAREYIYSIAVPASIAIF